MELEHRGRKKKTVSSMVGGDKKVVSSFGKVSVFSPEDKNSILRPPVTSRANTSAKRVVFTPARLKTTVFLLILTIAKLQFIISYILFVHVGVL